MNIWLVMKSTDGSERPFPVNGPRTVIGRETRCNVRIALPTVADRHCEIRLDGRELILSDLDSDHGTFVNGERISDRTALAHEDQVTIGPVTFEVRFDDGADGRRASLAAGVEEPGQVEVTVRKVEPPRRSPQLRRGNDAKSK